MHLTITLVSSPSRRDVQYIVVSCTAVTQVLVRTSLRDVQCITTLCTVHYHVMYSTLPHDVLVATVTMYIMSNVTQAWLAGSFTGF